MHILWFPRCAGSGARYTSRVNLRPHVLEALSLVMPSSCVGCGAEDRLVCEECRERLVPQVRTAELWHEGEPGLPLVYGLDYEEPVSGILHAFKESGATAAARPLGVALRDVLRQAVPILTSYAGLPAGTLKPGELVVTFPPSPRSNYRVRGYVPLILLLRRAGVGYRELLRPARTNSARADQSVLGRDERFDNMAGRLQAVPQAQGVSVLLVDDVATSGATLLECARALRAGGARVLGAVTLAHTPRRYSAHSQKNA